MNIYQVFERAGFSREEAFCIERMITVKTDFSATVPYSSDDEFRSRLISALKGQTKRVFRSWTIRENTTLQYLGDKFMELYIHCRSDFSEVANCGASKCEGTLLNDLGKEFFDEQERGTFESEKDEYYSEYLAYVAHW